MPRHQGLAGMSLRIAKEPTDIQHRRWHVFCFGVSHYTDGVAGSTILLGSEGFRLLPDLEALAKPEECIVKKHYEYAFPTSHPKSSLLAASPKLV